jgi:hypothetical protein
MLSIKMVPAILRTFRETKLQRVAVGRICLHYAFVVAVWLCGPQEASTCSATVLFD